MDDHRTVTPPTNDLVMARPGGQREQELCGSYLGEKAPEDHQLLLVSLSRPVDERLERLRTTRGSEFPETLGIITAGDQTRSSAEASRVDLRHVTPELSVENVESPGNLTQLGVAITNTLSTWEDGPISICFQSVTTLLQFVDTEAAFQFLHTLTQLVHNAGGVAHYHLDPTAHDDQVIATLRPVFDRVIDHREGGNRAETGNRRRSSDPRDGDDDGLLTLAVRDDEPPAETIGRAIASIEGIGVTTASSRLDHWVDLDAVDQLLRETEPRRGDAEVTFTVRTYRVTANTETVHVSEAG